MNKKYVAGNVCLNKEQMEVIEKAMLAFFHEHGVHLTRSQVLTWLAAQYLKQKTQATP